MSLTLSEVQAKIEQRKAILTAIKEELVERLELELEPADIDDDTFLFGGGLSLDSIDSMEIIIVCKADLSDDSRRRFKPSSYHQHACRFVIHEGGAA